MDHPFITNWGQTQFQRCKPLREERTAAETHAANVGPPHNRHGHMQTLQEMPWKSSAVNSDSTLLEWVLAVKNQPTAAPVENLHPAHKASSAVFTFVTPLRFQFLASYAKHLNDFAANEIFLAGANSLLVWVALGLSSVVLANPIEVWKRMKPVSFNLLGRVFWEHQLFNVMAYHAGFSTSPHPHLPDVAQVNFLKTSYGVQTLFKSFLDEWPRHLNRLFNSWSDNAPPVSPLPAGTIPSLEVANIMRNKYVLVAGYAKNQAGMLRPTVINNLAMTTAAMSALLSIPTHLPPPQADKYIEDLRERYKKLGLSVEELRNVELNQEGYDMYLPLLLALSVSPLLLLSAGSTCQNSKVSIPNLFALYVAFGNRLRPPLIDSIEHPVWQAVFEVYIGKAPGKEHKAITEWFGNPTDSQDQTATTQGLSSTAQDPPSTAQDPPSTAQDLPLPPMPQASSSTHTEECEVSPIPDPVGVSSLGESQSVSTPSRSTSVVIYRSAAASKSSPRIPTSILRQKSVKILWCDSSVVPLCFSGSSSTLSALVLARRRPAPIELDTMCTSTRSLQLPPHQTFPASAFTSPPPVAAKPAVLRLNSAQFSSLSQSPSMSSSTQHSSPAVPSTQSVQHSNSSIRIPTASTTVPSTQIVKHSNSSPRIPTGSTASLSPIMMVSSTMVPVFAGPHPPPAFMSPPPLAAKPSVLRLNSAQLSSLSQSPSMLPLTQTSSTTVPSTQVVRHVNSSSRIPTGSSASSSPIMTVSSTMAPVFAGPHLPPPSVSDASSMTHTLMPPLLFPDPRSSVYISPSISKGPCAPIPGPSSQGQTPAPVSSSIPSRGSFTPVLGAISKAQMPAPMSLNIRPFASIPSRGLSTPMPVPISQAQAPAPVTSGIPLASNVPSCSPGSATQTHIMTERVIPYTSADAGSTGTVQPLVKGFVSSACAKPQLPEQVVNSGADTPISAGQTKSKKAGKSIVHDAATSVSESDTGTAQRTLHPRTGTRPDYAAQASGKPDPKRNRAVSPSQTTQKKRKVKKAQKDGSEADDEMGPAGAEPDKDQGLKEKEVTEKSANGDQGDVS